MVVVGVGDTEVLPEELGVGLAEGVADEEGELDPLGDDEEVGDGLLVLLGCDPGSRFPGEPVWSASPTALRPSGAGGSGRCASRGERSSGLP